jgi:tetratricopeptide (TPR) repeat protein
MADYDKAIEISPDYFPAFYNRGVTKQADGDLDGAAADFTKTIELKPDYAPAYTARGSIRQFKGDNGGAKADYQQPSKYQNPGK